MFFRHRNERQLKMIWEARKDGRTSFLVGTAHFFPYSFRTTLIRLYERATTVLLEGPLDEENLAKVVKAGCAEERDYHIFDELDSRTIDGITRALSPVRRSTDSLRMLDLFAEKLESPVYAMVKGMKPWLAFFSLFFKWLQKNGWKHSVDQEAYRLAVEMGKRIITIETIEEQIEVLERISHERILDFLKGIDNWPSYTRTFVKWYLDGDLESIKSNPYGFPTRHATVIDDRDLILFHRMLPYFEEGDAVACVGAPHVVGIATHLIDHGFSVDRYVPRR